METRKMRAFFLDRDGIINEDYHYPCKPEHIRFRKGIFELCHKAVAKGYILIVVTNQAGVAKGKFDEQDVLSLHEWMKDKFAQQGIEISGFYYCPYHIEGVVEKFCRDSNMRKPKPGMFLQAAKEHNLDLSVSLMVGDKESDRIELTGLKSVIVKSEYTKTGYDVETLAEVEAYL